MSAQADTVRKARINLAVMADAAVLTDTFRKSLNTIEVLTDTYGEDHKAGTAMADSKRRLDVNVWL